METLNLDLGNAANWNEVYNQIFSVSKLGGDTYIPIAPIEIPYLFETRVLALTVFSVSAQKNWWLAGYVEQVVLTAGLALNEAQLQSKKIPLRKTSLIISPAISSVYKLVFRPVYWVEDVQLIAFEYTGPYGAPSEEAIDLARIDLLRVEAKINALHQWNQLQ